MRVLHITEALGGGIVHSIGQLARHQAADGFEVIVAHSVRPDTPSEKALERLFPTPIARTTIQMVTHVSPWRDAIGLIRLVALLRRLKPDVIHLHSSKAGVLGRIAARLAGLQSRSFYSPRGFAFLRQDVSSVRRRFFLFCERLAGKLGGVLLACSESEGECARELVKHPRVVVVDNSVDVALIKSAAKGPDRRNVRILTCGRICYQKAPWMVRAIADAFKGVNNVEFAWLGDGELAESLRTNSTGKQIEILGWMDRERVYDELRQADVFLLPSLWEGMPLALIEAQVAGIPALVSDAVGCRDVVIDNTTGYICKTKDQFIDRLTMMIKDSQLRLKLGAAAREIGLQRFDSRRMHKEIATQYERVVLSDANVPAGALEEDAQALNASGPQQ